MFLYLHVSNAAEERRVEVKGSTGPARTVELTIAEVQSAKNHGNTDLYLVSDIEWGRLPDGSIWTDFGTERVIHNWVPRDEALTITKFRYTVPEDASSTGTSRRLTVR